MFAFARYFWLTGIRRSGNHALQTWLLGPFGDRALKLNYTAKIEGQRLAALRAGYREADMVLIQGAEQLDEIKFEMPPMVSATSVKQLVILRNPLNNLSSQARLWGMDRFTLPKVVAFLALWEKYALEFLGRASSLPAKVSVNYDHWFMNKGYRRELAVRLEIPFSDATLNAVDEDWGKSSFDGMMYDGKAQQLAVLDRWRAFVDTPQMAEFLDVFQDHRAFPLFQEIYGDLPEELAIRRGRRYHRVEA